MITLIITFILGSIVGYFLFKMYIDMLIVCETRKLNDTLRSKERDDDE